MLPDSLADHKCTITLYDLSIEDASAGISINIFRPEADMPHVTAADIVVLTNVKVQRYRADPLSLIANWSTSVRVYSTSKIPRPPKSAEMALVPATSKRDSHTPSAQEHFYVSYLYHKIDKDDIPDEESFTERAARSLNVKDKFSLLQDVQDGRFCDLIAQVAREPHALMYDMVTLYVSDYTENASFHPQIWEGLNESDSGGGDQYGYTSGSIGMPKKEWVGPYGKMSIQITCYEPHASIIRSEVSAGQWVALRNIQIKYGHDGRYLEGFLRGDRNSVSTRLEILGTHDRETIDPRLKDAIRRFRDYSKKKKSQIEDIKSAHVAGQKRRASGSADEEKRSLNSKTRRMLNRAAQDQKEEEQRINKELRLSLNDQITCEVHSAPFSTIESILESVLYKTTVGGHNTALALPFVCAKYRVHARVVNFYPPALEDFACGRKQTDFDMLSDNEDDGSSDDDDEEAPGTEHIWEWRFALQLEDPTPPSNKKSPAPRQRVWVFVDNNEAQCLTGLDASDLRRDPNKLATLRQRMFILWGELEEHKAMAIERKREKDEAAKKDKGKGKQRQPRFEKPPLESSDVEDDGGDGEQTVSNKPFCCCIRQYGVFDKNNEEGREWVRCYGMFGTKICD